MKITDEMIARYRAKQLEMFGTNQTIDVVRELLEMALNPPVEPEIVVTEEMINAGNLACTGLNGTNAYLTRIYCAMRKLEPAQTKLCWSEPVVVCNRRMTDKPVQYGPLPSSFTLHQRKDDWPTRGATPHARKDNHGPEKGLTYFHKRACDSAFVVGCHHRKDGAQ